jgi:hypothetical protein
MTFIKDEMTLEKAMEAISESIADFKRFAEALDKFLKTNNLGSAEYSSEYSAVEFRAGEHGYDIAMFHLRDRDGEDVIYLYVYTDGTVQGENFSLGDRRDRINDGCTWNDAVREILKTVGVAQHTPLSREKIDKAIELFGG